MSGLKNLIRECSDVLLIVSSGLLAFSSSYAMQVRSMPAYAITGIMLIITGMIHACFIMHAGRKPEPTMLSFAVVACMLTCVHDVGMASAMIGFIIYALAMAAMFALTWLHGRKPSMKSQARSERPSEENLSLFTI